MVGVLVLQQDNHGFAGLIPVSPTACVCVCVIFKILLIIYSFSNPHFSVFTCR